MFNISEYLNSQEFKDLMKDYHKDLKEDNSISSDSKYGDFRSRFNGLVSEALFYYQYFIFKKDNVEPSVIENFHEHMKAVAADKDAKFRDDEVRERMYECFKKNEPFWGDEMVFKMAFSSRMIDSQCMFHAFNANFVDNVRANGIDPQSKGYDEEEIAQMGELLSKYQTGLNMGCSSRCKGRVYFTTRPLESPSYANTSPEWFNQFTLGNFAKGKYDNAKNEILYKLTATNVPQEDIDKIMNFFDKSWNKFYTPDAKPKIAMIPIPAKETDSEYARQLSNIYNDDVKGAWNAVACVHNGESETTLDVSQGEIIDIPNVNTMLRELNQEYNMAHQNELAKEGVQQAPATPAPTQNTPTTPPTNLNGNGNGGQGDENEGGMER